MLEDIWFADVRAMREATFTHAVVFRTRTESLRPNNEPAAVTVSDALPVPGKLVAPSAADVEAAAARGVRIQWVLKIGVDETVGNVGNHAVVTASVDEGSWVRTVAITADLTGPTARINRRLAAVDTTLNA